MYKNTQGGSKSGYLAYCCCFSCFVYWVKEYNWLYILPGRRQWSNWAGKNILYEGFGCDHLLQAIKFQDHIKLKINKAYSMLGILRRNFKEMDVESFITLYKVFVRSHLVYLLNQSGIHITCT